MCKNETGIPIYLTGAPGADVSEHAATRCICSTSRHGVTLVEVCVSAMILIFIFSGLSATVAAGRRGASLAENKAAALHIARQEIEKLRTEDFFAAVLNAGTSYRTHQLPNNRGEYKVTKVDDRTKNVEMIIRWREPSGKDIEVSLVTSFSGSLHR